MKQETVSAAEYRRRRGVARKPARRPRVGGPVPDVVAGQGWVEFVAPVCAVSALNLREHWTERKKRVASERKATHLALTARREGRDALKSLTLPLSVTLTRIGPRRIDDDNSTSGLKGVRDAVAAVLGINDGDARVKWIYGEQERGKHAVRIRVEERR